MDDLFSSPDFAWTIRMRRDDPGAFFARKDPSGHLLQERNHWLDQNPELCLALSPEGEPLIHEAWDRGIGWGQLEDENVQTLESLGRNWETDFILLDADTFTLAGGCVCFPSLWSLQESTGKTLDEVHGVVPRLNEQIGEKIVKFLERLPKDQVYLRENWGLTRTGDLNYHPELKRPRIDDSVPLDEVFLRIEHQAFVRLPSGVLMGIRIEPVSVQEVIESAPETARRLAGQLATMPAEVASYKSLSSARTWLPKSILEALRASA